MLLRELPLTQHLRINDEANVDAENIVPKQSDVVSPAVSVPKTFHYCKMSFVPLYRWEMFCFIS